MVRHVSGLAPQEFALYPMLSAAENLRFFGRIYVFTGSNSQAVSRSCSASLDYKIAPTICVRAYSGAMKRRLNLAVALVQRPQLLFAGRADGER